MNLDRPWPAELLTIDVFAEIRKLATRRFKTPADSTVGFAGFLSSLGPRRIDIAARPGKLVFSCAPRLDSYDWLALLAEIFDPDRPRGARHDALVRLERDFDLDALAAFSIPKARVAFTHRCPHSGALETVELSPSAKPRRWRQPSADAGAEALRIAISGKLGRASSHASALEHQGRFSPLELRLKGRRISRGHRLGGMLLSRDLSKERLRGVIGLPRKPGLCELHLLKHGMVTQTKLWPVHRGLEFHAVVEHEGLELPEIWRALRSEAEELLIELRRRIEQFDKSDWSRSVDLLVERAAHARSADLLAGARLFSQSRGRPLSIEELRERARKEKIYVVASEDKRVRPDPRGKTTVVLSSSARNLLEKHHGVTLHTALRSEGRIAPKLAVRARWRWQRIARRQAVRNAPEVSLGELAKLAQAVEDALTSGLVAPYDLEGAAPRVALSAGKDGPLRVSNEGRLLHLCTHHPLVRACARAYKDDPAALVPALAALFEGRASLSETGLERLIAPPRD